MCEASGIVGARGVWRRTAAPLVALDAVAISAGWLLAPVLGGSPIYHGTRFSLAVTVVVVVAVVLCGNLARRLYAEGTAHRAVELVGCARSCFVAGIFVLVAGRPLGIDLSLARTAGSTAICLLVVLFARSAYNARLTSRYRANQAVSPVLLVGTNDEGYDLCRLLEDDYAFGFRPAGVLGNRGDYDLHAFSVPWLGETASAPAIAQAAGIDQVFVARTSMTAGAFHELWLDLNARGVQVTAASGFPGTDQRRLRVMPVSSMPMFCLQAHCPSRGEALVKRSLDVVLAAGGLLLALPVMAAVALAILVVDGRPVLFRQTRVGRDGIPFTLLKFRTMIPDAEDRLINLRELNERQGPLFKLSKDPRTTRLGRLLRGSKIDELPQLVNVLGGAMSLVGPRPALPSECEEFSQRLLARTKLQPGITGLWQVEAGEDPSFTLYERLDLFYVENWSLSLDLALLIATVPTVAWHAYYRLRAEVRQRLSARAVRKSSAVDQPGSAGDQAREAAPGPAEAASASVALVFLTTPTVDASGSNDARHS